MKKIALVLALTFAGCTLTGCPPHQSAAPHFHPAANPAAVP